MKKLLRLIKKLLLWGLLFFIIVLVYNTLTFSSKQIEVEPIEVIDISNDAIQRFSQAIQFPTISYPHSIDTAAFVQLDSFITKKYVLIDSFLEKKKINEYSLVYKWQGRNSQIQPILYMGHLDVVPIEAASAEKWTVPPFSGKIQDEHIWGRGTLDDKVNVFGLLESIEKLLQEGYVPERTVWLAFGHDEEVSGINGAQAIVKMFQEEGIRFEYVLDEGALTLENALGGLNEPLAMIGIAEKGYTTLSLSVHLKNGGHSSMPPKESAIGILGNAIAKIEANPIPARIDGATKGLFSHVGPEMAFFKKVLFANLWCSKGLLINELSKDGASNAMIRTTTAPTMIRAGIKDNVLPSTASAKVNFRILPGDSVESIKAHIRNTIEDERVLVGADSKFSSNPSAVSDTENYGFKVIQKTIKEIFPTVVVAPSLVIAATDSRHYEAIADNIYRFTPIQITKPDLKRIHGIDERLSIDEYKRCIRFYRQLILNSCK